MVLAALRPEQGTQQSHVGQAVASATELVATEAQPSPSGAVAAIAAKTVPGKTAKNGWRAGEEGGTAAPPTQPDSRELATAVSAEVLSATLQAKAKAKAIVSIVEHPTPCAGCRLDGLLHPQAREQRALDKVRPSGPRSHRHEKRRGYDSFRKTVPLEPGRDRSTTAASPACRSGHGEDKPAAIYTGLAQRALGLRGVTEDLSPRARKQRHATSQAITWTS